jgi:hypothetical protein
MITVWIENIHSARRLDVMPFAYTACQLVLLWRIEPSGCIRAPIPHRSTVVTRESRRVYDL